MHIFLSFGEALLLTIVIEAPVAWLLGLRTWHEQAVLLLINVITNPTLNLLLNTLGFFSVYVVKSPLDPLLIGLEAVVMAVEAVLMKVTLGRTWPRCAAVSIAANTLSWLAGALILWH